MSVILHTCIYTRTCTCRQFCACTAVDLLNIINHVPSLQNIKSILFFSFQTKHTTRHSLAVARIPTIELSSDEDDALSGPVRRSLRPRTPTRYFQSELPVRRNRRSVTPRPAGRGGTAKGKNYSTEEDEDDEKVEVDRSKYELRSHAGPKRSPHRQQPSTHYFNSETPQHHPRHHTPQQPSDDDDGDEGWIAEESEEPKTYELHATAKHTTVGLSSDEEATGTGEASAISQISMYESKMRKRLDDLSNMTKKMVSEALTGRPVPVPQPAQPQSQPDEPVQPTPPTNDATSPSLPSPPVTRSRVTARSHRVQPSQPPITRMSLRSSKASANTEQEEKKMEKSTQVSPIAVTTTAAQTFPEPLAQESEASAQESHPSAQESEPLAQESQPLDVSPQTPPQPYPQWAQLGWEEVIFTLIIVALVLFAYYCFYSPSC